MKYRDNAWEITSVAQGKHVMSVLKAEGYIGEGGDGEDYLSKYRDGEHKEGIWLYTSGNFNIYGVCSNIASCYIEGKEVLTDEAEFQLAPSKGTYTKSKWFITSVEQGEHVFKVLKEAGFTGGGGGDGSTYFSKYKSGDYQTGICLYTYAEDECSIYGTETAHADNYAFKKTDRTNEAEFQVKKPAPVPVPAPVAPETATKYSNSKWKVTSVEQGEHIFSTLKAAGYVDEGDADYYLDKYKEGVYDEGIWFYTHDDGDTILEGVSDGAALNFIYHQVDRTNDPEFQVKSEAERPTLKYKRKYKSSRWKITSVEQGEHVLKVLREEGYGVDLQTLEYLKAYRGGGAYKEGFYLYTYGDADMLALAGSVYSADLQDSEGYSANKVNRTYDPEFIWCVPDKEPEPTKYQKGDIVELLEDYTGGTDFNVPKSAGCEVTDVSSDGSIVRLLYSNGFLVKNFVVTACDVKMHQPKEKVNPGHSTSYTADMWAPEFILGDEGKATAWGTSPADVVGTVLKSSSNEGKTICTGRVTTEDTYEQKLEKIKEEQKLTLDRMRSRY